MADAPAATPTDPASATPPADPSQPPASVLGGATVPGAEGRATVPGGEGKPPAAAEPAKSVVPESYEFSPPEVDGKPVEVNAGALDAFKATAKELGLTQEQFAGVTKAGIDRIQALAAEPYKAWADQQRTWQAELDKDPELSGAARESALQHAGRALDKFGGDALREALVVTGAGNNPAVVRAFIAIGKAMDAPAGLSTGKPASAAPKTPEQHAREMYGPKTYPEN